MVSEVSANTIENAFISLGLSEEHARVYFSALKLGSTTASNLAKHAKLPRSSTYDILNILAKKGFISVVETTTTKTFSANNPNIILDLLSKEKESLDSNLSIFRSNIGAFEEIYLSNKATLPKVRFFEGESGLKTVLYDALGAEEILGICQGNENNGGLDDEPQYLKDYLNELKLRKKRVRDLLEDSKTNREFRERYESKYYRCRLMPAKTKDIEHVDKQIYGDKIAYISHDNKVGVIIEDRTLAIYEKTLFEELWNLYL